MPRTTAALARPWLFATSLALSAPGRAEAKTAVLFGASGTVGNEILKALVVPDDDARTFAEVILVGRREFPPAVTGVLPPPSASPKIVTVVRPDGLDGIDRHAELTARTADACFVAVGAAFPHRSDYRDWHDVEVGTTGAIVRACAEMGAATVSVFTSVDAAIDPAPPADEALEKTGTPMGWWPVLAGTIHMMGLKESAVVSAVAAADVQPAVRLFQPSNIVTKDTRYGWFDWTLFKLLPLLDRCLPLRYHSVTPKLLAQAMVGDAMNVLSETGKKSVGTLGGDGATRLTYGDFLEIVAWEAPSLGSRSEL